MVKRWRGQPQKLWLGFSMLIAAHHFLRYAQQVSEELDHEIQQLDAVGDAATPLPAGVA
jgi:hypothetical protein